jgi:hypothetical protein
MGRIDEPLREGFATKRMLCIALCMGLAGFVGYFAPPLFDTGVLLALAAISAIVFPIFFCSLMITMVMAGRIDGMNIALTKEQAIVYRKSYLNKITRLASLGAVYVLTFISALLVVFLPACGFFSIAVLRTWVFGVTLSALASLGIPYFLHCFFAERYAFWIYTLTWEEKK